MRSPAMLGSRAASTSTSETDRASITMAAKRRFQLLLIKPSHYDDDGYVIRWWRAMIPSNSLAALYGIAADCAERQVLGPDVAIDIEAIDETNTRVDAPALIARLRSSRRFRPCWARRRSVEPISPRSRYRAAVPRRRHPRRDRWVPCIGLPVDARRTRGRARCLPRHGHRHVCGRSRGPARRRCCRTRPGRARAGLQFHEGPAGDGRHAGAVPPEAICGAHARAQHEFRRRPRLPLSMLVLHHHQRAGPQIALSFRR